MVPRRTTATRATTLPVLAWALGIHPRVAQARIWPPFFGQQQHSFHSSHFATSTHSFTMGKQQPVTMEEKYILGNDGTPFYTREYYPTDGRTPDAFILFHHGFAEHIGRYDAYFRLLAAAPHNLHITAFDSRGHGKTSQQPLAADAPEIKKWRDEGLTVVPEKGQKHRTGGWARQLPDFEFMVKREAKRAQAAGRKLFLYGHSMGGGLTLGFCTRGKHGPPAPETLKLVSGIIASAPFIRQTKPAGFLQLKAGNLAAAIGLGNFVIPIPLDVKDFTKDLEVQERTAKDPMCAAYGSLKSLSDMISYGASLDTHAAWDAFPQDLPLLIVHGGDDQVADPKAAVRFGDMVVAKDKTTKVLQGLLHEPHNELAPEPAKLADLISNWVHKRIGETVTPTVTSSAPASATSAPEAETESPRLSLPSCRRSRPQPSCSTNPRIH
ncbi:alpha/beta-hydrolase [Cutaneotrichosporon oleaginosum]|uniref:Alpha/beta-hydrolase n=1 Tax=Cutaneotrichosporon oleaginosum TaxID=879819 RepID=A0A0J0XIP5_9TREE|nr:alpha/beta-hydrolase [Cutaneotrichosporon oleaginosum]KLT40943.1 alpha/beta-hydrolase [Cutaneotrichosporon oleaginosum]TXT15435.1 hypothetical protein COLE_01628 [Cutaneotrichosporon oleaginosum]